MNDAQLIALDGEPLTHEAHPELHHYTDEIGLRGILNSNELWATHYTCLNDTTEVFHLRSLLIPILARRVHVFVEELKQQRGRNYRRFLKKHGMDEDIARREAQNVVDTLYEVTFKGKLHVSPFASPFIVSFCSHAASSPYERENGILSQWNRYGGDRGFAIVFDTLALSEQLAKEAASYQYEPLSIPDVIYALSPDVIESRFKTLVDDLESWLRDFVSTGRPDAGKLYGPFLHACTRLKHQGFREELEVRIVASPRTRELDDFIKRQEPSYEPPLKPFKEILRRDDNKIGYLRLFDYPDKTPLPIKRIIVGPHKHQRDLRIIVEELAQGRFPVACCETPFIPKR